MVSLADSMLSSSARALPIRKRPDLSARKHYYLGKTYWIVKDPVGLHYFRFQEEEYAILQMLDGETSLDEIKERFEAEFPPQKITLEEIQHFLGMLHHSGLILAGVQGQGTQLLKRRGERRRRELLGMITNILCVRFKGIDPERMLSWLYPKVRWFFSPAAVTVALVLMILALLLVGAQFVPVARTNPPADPQQGVVVGLREVVRVDVDDHRGLRGRAPPGAQGSRRVRMLAAIATVLQVRRGLVARTA